MEDFEFPCICKHEKGVHLRSKDGAMNYCAYCEREGFFKDDRCIKFQLDNLQLIEDLAKEQDLV